MEWATLFMVGSVWFWALIVVVSCILFALIEYEKVVWSTITLLLTLFLVDWLGDVDFIPLVRERTVDVLLGVVGYFAAGTLWSIVKWWFYVRNCREKYNELKARWLESKHVSDGLIPEPLKQEWGDHLKRHGSLEYQYRRHASVVSVIPQARDQKGRILTWMIYWPWSMVWTLINDPVKRLFKQIFKFIQQMLQNIANRAFRGVESDLPSDKGEGGGGAAPDGSGQRGTRRPLSIGETPGWSDEDN